MGCFIHGPCYLLEEIATSFRISVENSSIYKHLAMSVEQIVDKVTPQTSDTSTRELESVAKGAGDDGLLADEFTVKSNCGDFSRSVQYQVVLKRNQITFSQWPINITRKSVSSEPYVLQLEDVIGSNYNRSWKADTACHLTIYAYPRKKAQSSSTSFYKIVGRKKVTVTLVFDKKQNYEGNEKSAELWKTVLCCLLKGQQITPNIDLQRLELPVQKKVLVLVNPFSGPGKALSIFEEKAAPMFAEAGIHYNLVVTEKAGHAHELVQELNLEEWHGIVIVSGDGLIYEVVNGLMQRPDWKAAIKTPIGTIPGGSGNALSCGLNFYAGESWLESPALHASYVITKHLVLPLDIVALELCNGKRVYSFLDVTWGYMSDVDIESERFRAIGNARFTVGALVRLVGLRRYRGKVSFLPVNEYKPRVLKNSKAKFRRSQSEYYARHDSNIQSLTFKRATSTVNEEVNFYNHSDLTSPRPSIAEGEKPTFTLDNMADDNSVFSDATFQSKGVSERGDSFDNACSSTQNSFSAKASGDAYSLEEANSKAANQNVFSDCSVDSAISTVNSFDTNTVLVKDKPQDELTPLLRPLTESVPENWVTIDDDFVSVAAISLTHLGPDLIFSQNRRLDEGEIDLHIIYHGISRNKLMKGLLDLAEGKVKTNEHVEFIRVKAFRIEPLTDKGMIAVDGERVQYGPIQGQIIKGMGRVMAKEKT